MKKGLKTSLILCAFATFIALGLLAITSAFDLTDPYSYSNSNIMQTLKDIIESIFSDYQTNQQVFFVKILLFIIIFVLCRFALKAVPKLGEQDSVVNILAVVVSILAIKWMSKDLVQLVLLPYGALGIALATILPFIIFLYFVHSTNMSGLGRRLAWMLFGISFIAVFLNRYAQISQTGRYFYLAILVAIILAFVFDKGLHHYFFLHELNLFFKGQNQKLIASLQAEYSNIAHLDSPEAKARKDKIRRQLKELGAEAP